MAIDLQQISSQIVPDGTNIAGAITAFGLALLSANEHMLNYKIPMVIREFYFATNMAADFVITEQLDITYTDSGMNVADRHYNGYAKHMGITVKCVFIPLSIATAKLIGASGADQ